MIEPTSTRSNWKSRVGVGLAIAAILIASVLVVARFWPIGPDYYFTFHDTAEKWLKGETRLYDDNATGELPNDPGIGFLNAPWTLIVLVPLTLLPLEIGQAVLNVGSIVGILWCIRALQQTKPVPLFAIALALANLHTLDMLLRGQIDVLPFIGVVLGWWAVQSRRPLALSIALAVIATKPTNVILPSLIFLIAIRHWRWSEILTVLSVPVILFALSEIIFGFDWPLRYIAYSSRFPPNDYLSISLWRGAAQIGFPLWPIAVIAIIAILSLLILAWRTGLNQWILAAALVTNALFSPYVHGNHLVLLIPALIIVARRDWRLAVLAYATTFTPLLRLTMGFDAARIDVLYPLILFVMLWGMKLIAARATTSAGRNWWQTLQTNLTAESQDEQRRLTGNKIENAPAMMPGR